MALEDRVYQVYHLYLVHPYVLVNPQAHEIQDRPFRRGHLSNRGHRVHLVSPSDPEKIEIVNISKSVVEIEEKVELFYCVVEVLLLRYRIRVGWVFNCLVER